MKIETEDICKKDDSTTEASSLTVENSLLTEIKLDSIDFKVEKEKIYNSELIFGNHIKSKSPIKLGNTIALFYYKGEPLVIIGPHWPYYLCLMTTISFFCYIYFSFLWDQLSITVKYVGVFIYLFQSGSYSYTAFINPGIPEKVFSISKLNAVNVKNKKICIICQIVIPPEGSIEHCHDCGVCIEEHDHHCPWTSKCIGKNNIKSFYCFVFGTFLLFGYIVFSASTITVQKKY